MQDAAIRASPLEVSQREAIVRTLGALVAVLLMAMQGGVPRSDSMRPPAVFRDSGLMQVRRTCVPTAPMPIAGLRARRPERMLIARPDSGSRDSVMVIRVVPCYLADSGLLRVRR